MTVPLIRKPEFDFDLPRYWHGGSLRATHLANAINFVFPAGERFFIRSVRHWLPQITDPVLRARVDAFIGQEAQHQRAHLAVFKGLEQHGFEIQSFLDWYERVAYGHIEPMTPPILRLATTAALEHFTATFGELALGTELLDPAHPVMQKLLRWHAAEEIEHRDVAFDVLMQVDDRYIVRFIGFLMALGTILSFWAVGFRHLMRQEPPRAAPVARVMPPDAPAPASPVDNSTPPLEPAPGEPSNRAPDAPSGVVAPDSRASAPPAPPACAAPPLMDTAPPSPPP